MVTQYGIKLAVSLISAHFGEIVAKVCCCLLQKGTLTLSDITRYTELPSQQAKNCLLVLIQHNCVQAFAIAKEGFGMSTRAITHYSVVYENILHRLRFSKFLTIVSEELDKECEELLEGLLQHGRLTLEQIMLRAMSKQNEGTSVYQDVVRTNFVRLVNLRYVERCPTSEPFLAPNSEEEAPSIGKRGPKSAKLGLSETIEQRAMKAASPSEAKRFLIVTDIGANVTEAKTGASMTNLMLGEKRKHKALETDGSGAATICEKEVLWRVNFEEFVYQLRKKVCASNVRSRLDDGASIILNAMLDATKSEENLKSENTVSLTMDAIFEEVIKSEDGRTMTLDHVRAGLTQLGCHPFIRDGEEYFSVDIKNIIEIAQNEEVESIMLKRYGDDAYRMFRLLSKTGHLVETEKISDMAFVERKTACKILYNLWKDGYLHMEKIISHGSTQYQFLLWKVNKHLIKEQVLDEMCHAVLNLMQRMAYELGKEHEILKLPREKRIGVLGKRFDRIRKVKILLDSSLLKLDDAIMLFSCF
ncbi:hypothetical protein Syun_020636 [Stephania yunnanensis]|uniref:DNA-directed RNA polymerase III subunit RPC3 n=1 Tax=Stephania yunnanensis TaxID=152371 RepID=A0AAP0IE68_9MAGN